MRRRAKAPGRRTRVGALVASLVASAGLLGGCGAPSDASLDSFCAATRAVQNAGDGSDDPAEEVKAVKEAYADLEDVGTPADIPPQARDGFEVIGQAIAAVPDDASAADLDQVDERVGAAGQDKVEAFFLYVSTACGVGGTS